MRLLTLILTAVVMFWAPVVAQERRAPAALAAAFLSIDNADWQEATRRAAPAGQLGKDIVEWHRLRAGMGTFAQYRRFLADHSDWPGLILLHRKGEASILSATPPEDVISYFEGRSPDSSHGVLQLARAFEARDQAGDAAAGVVMAWRTFALSKSGRNAFLAAYKDLLPPHHIARLDMLLWRGRFGDARRMYPLVSKDWQALAEARIALRRKAGNVDTLIEAVPKTLQPDPGLAYERFLWRAKKGFSASAIELLLERSKSAEQLGEPERWANRRRSLARQMMRTGDGVTAYRIASSHHLGEGSNFADLEWLSGYLALRYLNDPATALAHFQSFRVAVKSPISLGRAGYWEGRAYAAMGDAGSAQTAYAFGAEYQTSFYGLLAAEQAGFSMDAALTGAETFPDWALADFMSSTVLQAALLLHKANKKALAKRFFLQVAEGQDRVGLGQLADLALSLNEPHIALMIAKQGARRGLVLPRAYYPLHDLAKEELPVATELALAIARRESEFNPGVESGVGAKGLMQLMPRTAQSVAEELELDFEVDRLLTDWRYNARLGSTYLARLQDEFGQSPILISVGYNAGPSRARAWITAFGDPRSAGVDVVDWIEHIPFRETRNYVMRVSESLPVYRARLSGKTPPLSLSSELRQGG
ncbi:lytic transglycosylase domain-containing protein [Profundibacter sp.]